MDRTKKGYLNVLDLAYALKSIGQPVEEKEVRTMMMLANTVATVQSKNKALGGTSAHGWNPPGAKGGGQMGMTIDFTTFFELFAHSGQPIMSLEDCLIEWQSKFNLLNSSSDKSVTATSAVAQLESKMDFPTLLGVRVSM